MSRRGDPSSKVYVGDLPRDASEAELDREFSYFGSLRSVWVARNPPGFAFVEFDDPRDAEDSVRALDGRTICGARVRVEMSTGRSRGGGRRPPARKNFDSGDKCYRCNETGHYAYDCRNSGKRSRSRSRRRSNSRSGSLDRFGRSRHRSGSRGRSHSSHGKRSRSRSRSVNNRSPARNGD